VSDLERELVTLIERIVDERVAKALAGRAPEDRYLSIAEAAGLASVHPDTIRRWIRDGKLKDHRAGSASRVSRRDLERLLAAPRPRLVRRAPRGAKGKFVEGKQDRAPRKALTPEEMAARDFG
jgi:excisionase family DNA binding protein